jgi:hypothetical protein
MLAYVRDGSTISSRLAPFLVAGRAGQPDVYLTEALPESIWEHLARSTHKREFHYVRQSHGPGAITIWHLWIAPSPQ